MEQKQCNKCKLIKDISEFGVDRSLLSGIASICKQCNREKVKAYMQTEHGKQTRKAYEKTDSFKSSRQKYNRTESSKKRYKKYKSSPHGRVKIREYKRSDTYKQKDEAYRKSPKGIHQRLSLYNRTKDRNRERYSIKYKARRAVRQEIHMGRMPKVTSLQCADCGKCASEYHHHNGYEKDNWLNVTPLCKKCHGERHVIYQL